MEEELKVNQLYHVNFDLCVSIILINVDCLKKKSVVFHHLKFALTFTLMLIINAAHDSMLCYELILCYGLTGIC